MNKDLQIAKKTVQTEIQALKKLSLSFNRTSYFSNAVNMLSKMKGKCLHRRKQAIGTNNVYENLDDNITQKNTTCQNTIDNQYSHKLENPYTN